MTDAAAPRPPDTCTFVIFGITGDLAHRLVVPALYNLAARDLLPKKFCIAGVARKAMDADELSKGLRESLGKYAKGNIDDAAADRLLGCLSTIEADPSDPKSFGGLRDKLDAQDGDNANRIYYMATPPGAFAPIARGLGGAGLLKQSDRAWRRLIVEKPFGTDLDSARKLNAALLEVAQEEQIYRIDHFLGKETVQNILMLRFANGMFEPIWNRNHIDHVQITVDEALAVGTRGSFYDETGALRDMVSNHLFQFLSLVAMEPPARFDAHSVRSEKAQVLGSIVTQSHDEALTNSVRGQYTAGRIKDEDVPAYRDTKDVKPGSTTETYAALKVWIDNWRWSGVPFYLRTGKALGNKHTEVAIKFKQAPFAMFAKTPVESLAENYLVIGVEPHEGIAWQFNTKVPGPAIAIQGVEMVFNYRDYFNVAPATGYETLLFDCMTGDNMLFQRADSVEAGWQAVQPLLDAWKAAGEDGLAFYAPGSEGPDAAQELLARDGRSWREIAKKPL